MLDLRVSEKLSKGVPSILHGWPSYKPGLFFSLILRVSIFAKMLQISPQGNVYYCAPGLIFIVCLLFFFSRFIINSYQVVDSLV